MSRRPRSFVAASLAAWLTVSSALAGGATDVLRSVAPSPADSPNIYGGPGATLRQSAVGQQTVTNSFASAVLGATPTVGDIEWAVGFGHSFGCYGMSAGWHLLATTPVGFSNPPQVSVAWAYHVVGAGESATVTPFTMTSCPGTQTTAIAVWELSGLDTTTPTNNVKFSGIQDGGSIANAFDFTYMTASENNFAMVASAQLNSPVSAIGGVTPWTHLLTAGGFINSGDYSQRYVSLIEGSGPTSGQFQAAMLVLH